MRCPTCQSLNSPQNRFCGQCGAEFAESGGTPRENTPPRRDYARISGPSILGLDNGTDSDLHQDEEAAAHDSGWRWIRYALVGALLAVAGLALARSNALHVAGQRLAGLGARQPGQPGNRAGAAPIAPPAADSSVARSSAPVSEEVVVIEGRAEPREPANSPDEKRVTARSSQSSEDDARSETNAAASAGLRNSLRDIEPPPAPGGDTGTTRPADAQGYSGEEPSAVAVLSAPSNGDASTTTDAGGAPAPSARVPRPAPGNAEYQRALTVSDPEVAKALLWRAVSLGNSDAQLRLAEMYLYGQGVEPNCEQGVLLVRTAAERGSVRARGKLGVLYAVGKCVPRDLPEAYRWLSMALHAEPASPWLISNRAMVWREMSEQERAAVASIRAARPIP